MRLSVAPRARREGRARVQGDKRARLHRVSEACSELSGTTWRWATETPEPPTWPGQRAYSGSRMPASPCSTRRSGNSGGSNFRRRLLTALVVDPSLLELPQSVSTVLTVN